MIRAPGQSFLNGALSVPHIHNMKRHDILMTQSTSLAGAHRVSCARAFQTCSTAPRRGKKAPSRRLSSLVKAASVADQGFDLKSILEDSLKTPTKTSKAAAPSPLQAPAMPKAPSQPLQIPQSQTTAPVSGAGSSIEDAIKSTSTVENTIANPASDAASQSAEATGSAASSFAGKVSEGAGKITELGGGLPDAATSASQAAPGSVEAAASEAATQAAASTPKYTQGSALDAYMEATRSAKKGVRAAVPEPPSGASIQDTLSSAQDAVSSALSSLTEGVTSQAKAALGAASEATSGVQSAASGALETLNQATSGAVDQAAAALKELSGGVNEATSSLQESLSATAGAASSAAEAASASLPEPVRDALSAAKGPVSQAVSQVTSSPPLLVGAATLAVGLPAAGWVRDRLGGYNGALQPARALEVLQSENAILLDMRSEEERERDGTPALTAGAIGRGAAVPLPYISGPLSRNVRNADELAYQIAATVATGLVQIQPKAKIVVMDARGGNRAVRLARTLLANGISRAFIVQGGYRGWVSAGLPTKNSPEYAVSPVDVISERLSIATTTATGSLGRPAVILAAVAAGGVVYLSVFDTLLLLRWLGTFALLFTVFNRVVSYNSPNDFISDVQGIGRPFAWVGGRLSGLLPTSGAVSQPAELPERVPTDLNVEVEQTGAAIGEVQQAGEQAIEAAAETLGVKKREEKESTDAETVERNA